MSEASDAPATDSGPLSIDSAVELLTSPPEAGADDALPAEEVAADDEEQPAEAQPADGDDPPEGEPVEAEEEPESEPETPAIAAPKSWDATARAEFALLPPALQKTVAAREEERDRAISRAQTEASEARKRAEAEASGLGQYKAQLDQLIPQAEATFGDKWSSVDWVAWAEQDPAAAQIGRFQYEQEQQRLAQLRAVHQQTEQLALVKFVEAESERLKDVAPDLADPDKGPARRKAVGEYLVSYGIQPEQLRNVSAVEMSIAHKAMLWDQAQKAASSPKPKTAQQAAAPVRRPVTPAAAPAQNPTQRARQNVQNAFNSKPSVDNAVALLLNKKAS